jgi:cytokinesis protein
MAVSRMDAQSESEARAKGATGPTGSAAPNAARGPTTLKKQGFSTAQILVMAASGCVTALAVLILIVLAGDPTLGTVPAPLVATATVPRIAAAFDAPLRAIPPPPPEAPPPPLEAQSPAPSATETSKRSPPPSPPSLSVVPSSSPSVSPLVPTRTSRPPPPPPPPATGDAKPTTQPNSGPLFQRED